MTFNCFCGQKIDLNDSAEGQSFNCPSCNTTLVAPIVPKPPQFVQCPCQHCSIYIEFDSSYAGLSVKCPRCFESTKLFIPEVPVELRAEAKFSEHHDIYEGKWVNDPMTDKQKAMLVLYGIQFNEGMTKGEASKLIDQAVHSGQPTIHNQARGGEMFGKIRLNEITQEITKAINIIGDESATITILKDTKRSVKASVKSLTDIIDKRIETIQYDNMERRSEKTTEWLRQRGIT